jgi:hypothetical protein
VDEIQRQEIEPGRLKTKLVLFLGSGFSAALGLPTTVQLSERLLHVGDGGGEIYETFITATIAKFWEGVFGWHWDGNAEW